MKITLLSRGFFAPNAAFLLRSRLMAASYNNNSNNNVMNGTDNNRNYSTSGHRVERDTFGRTACVLS